MQSNGLTQIEELFTAESVYDSKNITNKSDKPVPTSLIDSVEKGVTIEALEDAVKHLKLPVFKYRTQITIHGIFPELSTNIVNGYAHIIRNQNKSVGVRYGAIDAAKKLQIARSIRDARGTVSRIYKWARLIHICSG